MEHDVASKLGSDRVECMNKKAKAGYFGLGALSMLVVVMIASMILLNMGSCNVAYYSLSGELVTSPMYGSVDEEGYLLPYTSSYDIVRSIEESEWDDGIKAIFVEIDSLGGSPVAGEEIANALKRSEKPSVAVIRGAGTSAAYWAATGADTIYASANSDVGGIGVYISYLDYVEKNRKEGIDYNMIVSGKYKILGDPNVKLNQEERNLLQRDVDKIHDNFVTVVSENREIENEKVDVLADGSTMLGAMAVENNLIDRIGDMHDAKTYIEELIGEEAILCEDMGMWF